MHWLDGVLQSGSDQRPDRGLEFGDGLFETIAVIGGRPRLVEAHIARLVRGCARLGIVAPDAAVLRSELELAARAPGTAILKLIVTRGEGGGGYAPRSATAARRVLYALPPRVRPAAFADTGVKVRMCATRLAEQPRLAGLKHLNRLEQVLARAEWADADAAEGLMLDVHGRLVCGTMTNVFLVKDDGLVTPALERAGVEGVMRAALMSAFRGAGARVEVRDVDPGELAGASELFLTNALIGAWPVAELDGRRFAPGSWVRRAQAWIGSW